MKWINCKTKMPSEGQRVLAKYEGVYGARAVTYWFDGVNHHFGEPPVSHPATHWCPLDSKQISKQPIRQLGLRQFAEVVEDIDDRLKLLERRHR